MDLVAKNEETDIAKITLYTFSAFVPILEERKEEIFKIERKTFKYGTKNRHHLDVYYPPNPSKTANGKTPILFFIYGGGFNNGSRQLPEPYSMGYRALGAFFANRGFLVVVPDYRLVPEVRYPAASQDIRDALVWVSDNTAALVDPAAGGLTAPGVEPDAEYVFVLSHSAGSVHTKVMALHPDIRGTLPSGIRGYLWSAGAWYIDVQGESFTKEGPPRFYFGTPEQQREREPRALWKNLNEEEVQAFPEVVLVHAEREPQWLLDTEVVMAKDLEERLGKPVKKIVSKGHNHISPNWALSSGQGEEWGYEVSEWIHERIGTPA
ncbi:alpha beta hydrolase domain-containing protein [Coniophora puteana RWD-64-598 SS2]|uniref:Alpha beta hydrolase domain-containing protein n=1 Tax=Coniophora puteana (strain RWD-64-598) TaxID=741705 RepID=A0A5M3MFQ6_CONPW|nr:alpha beta hydrolase domain-containing protein [Coniophora puteana RWD-64-598 SS2]EIW77993.1 alpha beta hydrolase domain-containing protein [Coniophora puteana RWD-64-598 SS2]